MNRDQLSTIEHHFEQIMLAMNLDLNDPNYTQTPRRFAKAYNEIFAGLDEDADEELEKILKVTFPASYNEMVLAKNLQSWSMCPHHFLPVKLRVDIAYIPDEKVIGISKLPRMVNLLAARPCLQEQLTTDIVTKIDEVLKPKGAIVRLTGEHLCMTMRGVKSNNSSIITTAFLGCFEDQTSRSEFFDALK